MRPIYLNDSNGIEEKLFLLENVFKNLVDAVFVFDLKQNKIVVQNPALGELFGFDQLTSEQISRFKFKDIIHPEDILIFEQTIEKLKTLKEKEFITLEARIKNAEGEFTYYQTRVSVFHEDEDGVAQVICISRDMSEKVRYELHKQRSVNTLKELSFITSHELRHEYAKIQSIIQLIDNKFIDENERQVLLDEAKHSIQIINSTIFKINHKLSFNQNDSFFENTAIVARYKKVILVDDDSLTNMLNKKIIQLSIRDMPVEIFSTTDEAIGYLRENDNSGEFLIFLDINFPDNNGWSFLEMYSQFPKKSKVIMLSSSIDNDDRIRARSFDAVIDYITKPLSIDFVEGLLKV